MKLTTRDLILIPLFSALMIVGAFVRIPFPLLPVTLQAFFCALAGLILGPRLGAISMSVYALLGLSGVPVFAQGGGPAYLFNKSFGFILGFIAGAYVIGKAAPMTLYRELVTHTDTEHSSPAIKNPSNAGYIKAVMAGLLVIYAIGISYMFIIIRLYLKNTQIGLYYILTANLPYFIKDAVLFAVAAIASKSILPVMSKVKT